MVVGSPNDLASIGRRRRVRRRGNPPVANPAVQRGWRTGEPAAAALHVVAHAQAWALPNLGSPQITKTREPPINRPHKIVPSENALSVRCPCCDHRPRDRPLPYATRGGNVSTASFDRGTISGGVAARSVGQTAEASLPVRVREKPASQRHSYLQKENSAVMRG